MKSCLKFKLVISHTVGSLTMVPGRCMTDGVDEPITERHITSKNTRGAWVPEKVKERWLTQEEVVLRVSGGERDEVGGKDSRSIF